MIQIVFYTWFQDIILENFLKFGLFMTKMDETGGYNNEVRRINIYEEAAMR